MTRKKQIMLFGLVFVLLLLPAMWMYSRDTVSIGGQQLVCWDGETYRAGGDSLTIAARADGADFDLTLYGEHTEAALRQEGDKIIVTFATGKIVEGYDKGLTHLMNADGSFLDADPIIVLVGNELAEPLGKTALADRFFAIWKYGGEQWGPLWFPLLMGVVYVLGVVQILWPEETYFFFSRWMFRHAELSDEGLMMRQLGGWIAAVGSVVLMYGPLFIP